MKKRKKKVFLFNLSVFEDRNSTRIFEVKGANLSNFEVISEEIIAKFK
jgi:hypothetical protein